MADPSEYRTKGEEEEWKAKDPVLTLKNRLLEEGLMSDEELQAMFDEVEREVEEAVAFADESPYPEMESLFDDVYAD